MKKTAFFLSAAALCLVGGAASAAQYTVTFTGVYESTGDDTAASASVGTSVNAPGDPDVYALTLTTSDTPTMVDGDTAYAVTGATGTHNGVAVTGVDANFPTELDGPDNYLFLDEPFVSDLGISLDFADGTFGNLFYDFDSETYAAYEDNNVDGADATELKAAGLLTVVPFTPTTPAVPEPASWALMISGFGLVGGALRRRQSVSFAA